MTEAPALARRPLSAPISTPALRGARICRLSGPDGFRVTP
jgi:hypothetical protein